MSVVFQGPLGSLGHLGVYWERLGHFGDPSGVFLVAFWGPLASMGVLWVSFGLFGDPFGGPLASMGVLWGVFCPLLGPF